PPVDEVQRGGGYVAAEFPPRSEGQHQPDGACRHDQDEQSGRQEAPGPASVELSQVDGAAAAYLLQERTGDQVARQDEENVHPDEIPAETGDSGVIEQHEKDRDRSHSLDVWPEAGRTMSTHELT